MLSKLASSVSSSSAAGIVVPAATKIRHRSQTNRNQGDWKYRKNASSTNTVAAVLIGGALAYGFTSYGDALIVDASLDSEERHSINELKKVCSNVIVSPSKTKSYVTGQRIGKAQALAVCRPKSLREAVNVLQVCADRDLAVIPQGANTGLTGGSVPRENIDRPTVVINMRLLDRITPVGNGDKTRMICLPGSGILSLSKEAEAKGRESHSVLGSLFLNPSTAAGIAFGSGGTQVRKGPVYTERVVYARVNADGKVEVVDHTGIKSDSIDDLFRKLENGNITEADLDYTGKLKFWDDDYPRKVSTLDNKVSRFNADSSSPCEASRSEGKVLILGSVHQTFPRAKKKNVYWLSTDCFNALSDVRKRVVLGDPTGKTLPASCEYMNKDTVDITLSHGSTACAAILYGGMSNLARMYALQHFVDSFLPIGFSDRILQLAGLVIPRSAVLPKAVLPNLKMAHHLLLDISEFGDDELNIIKQRFETVLQERGDVIKAVPLMEGDVVKSNIFRFTNAAAFKIYCLLTRCPGVSLDYALRKNDYSGFPKVPAPVNKRMIYGHLACNVIHDDVAFERGVDPHSVKYQIKSIIEKDGGVLPAEHGHGTEYPGDKAFQKKLMKTDPLNMMNPGVAGTSPLRRYNACSQDHHH